MFFDLIRHTHCSGRHIYVLLAGGTMTLKYSKYSWRKCAIAGG